MKDNKIFNKIAKVFLSVVAIVNMYGITCFADTDEVVSGVTEGMNGFMVVVVRIVQLIGAILMIKNVADFSSSWKQSDDSGMFSAGKGIAGAAILLAIQLILGLFGVKI